MTAIKHDTGKDPWHLLPIDALWAITKVLAMGAIKYGERNWESGLSYSRCYSALQRHLTAWFMREDKDPESGMSHLWHAATNALFLVAFEIRGVGTDDRPSVMARPIEVRICQTCTWDKSGDDTCQSCRSPFRNWVHK